MNSIKLLNRTTCDVLIWVKIKIVATLKIIWVADYIKYQKYLTVKRQGSFIKIKHNFY